MRFADASKGRCDMPVKLTVVFGGSFDPPHIGHQEAVLRLLNMPGVDQVIVLPCYEHRFDKKMSEYLDRLKMARAAFGIFRNVEISNLELYVDSKGSMIEIVKHLLRAPGSRRFALAIGADNYSKRDRWDRFDELEKLVEKVIVLERPEGAVSSTQIREMVRRGEDVSHMVPSSISWHVEKLYTNTR